MPGADDTDKGIKTNLAFPDSGVAVFVTAKRIELSFRWMAFKWSRPMMRSNSVKTPSRSFTIS